jgi:hypothetical protein
MASKADELVPPQGVMAYGAGQHIGYPAGPAAGQIAYDDGAARRQHLHRRDGLAHDAAPQHLGDDFQLREFRHGSKKAGRNSTTCTDQGYVRMSSLFA